jgi:hypothetical protein
MSIALLTRSVNCSGDHATTRGVAVEDCSVDCTTPMVPYQARCWPREVSTRRESAALDADRWRGDHEL